MSKKSSLTRTIALELMMELEADNQKLHILVRGTLDKYSYLDKRDRAFLQYLIEGTVTRRITLDYIIDLYAGGKKIKPIIRNILRLSLFQIMYMDSVPDSAACNEAVNLAIDNGLSGLKGFVNGLLRNVSRNKQELQWPDENDTNMFYSALYSIPPWMVKYLTNLYGKEDTRRILEASLERGQICLRFDERLTNEERVSIIDQLIASGARISKHPYLDYVYTTDRADIVASSTYFRDGAITIQDISSVMAVELAGIKAGDYVIDMCAAPGGKSVHASLKCGPNGHVEARELQANKLHLIEENAARMKADNIEVICQDATVVSQDSIDKADVVICDVPCSGLGVMGRKCDIRYNVSKGQLKDLQALGRAIIDNGARYVKKGGILLYSTCTITREENLDNRQYILDKGMFEPVSIEKNLPDELRNTTGAEGYLQLLQGIHSSDGFFISVFRRIK